MIVQPDRRPVRPNPRQRRPSPSMRARELREGASARWRRRVLTRRAVQFRWCLLLTIFVAALLALLSPASDGAFSCLPRGSATMIAAGLELVASYMIAGTAVSCSVVLTRRDAVPTILAELIIVGLVGAGISIWAAVRLIETRCI